MGLKIKILTDISDSAINDYFNSFHNSQRTNEAFIWEFINTPASQSIYIHALDENENIVGAISVLFLEIINCEGDIILTGKPEDVMVDINASLKYRKEDIFKLLYNKLEEECILRGVSLFWGFTYANRSFKRMGFDSSFKSNNGMLVINPLKAYKYLITLNKENKFLDKVKISVLSCVSYIKGLTIGLIPNDIKGTIIIDDILDHNKLLKSHLSNNKYWFSLNQDEEFLKWRIFKNPYPIKFNCIGLKNEKSEQQAEIIYSIRNNICFIEQLLWDKKMNIKELKVFIKYVINIIKSKNVSLVRFMGFNNSELNKFELKLFEKTGFIFTKRGIPFIFKILSKNASGINCQDIFLSRLFTQGDL